MKYKMTIYPALEIGQESISIQFETAEQMLVSKDACANLLLFVQDKLAAMPDYSNMFIVEEFVDGEWLEYEYFDEEF